jgi:hypothetical protein
MKLHQQIIKIAKKSNMGHIGSALSVIDLIAVLYDKILDISAVKNPNRDRFILSKGHSALALYVVLHSKGFINDEELNNYGANSSKLGVHPEHFINGVDFSTGSLGQGISIAVGSALAGKIQKSSHMIGILLQVQRDFGPPSQRIPPRIGTHVKAGLAIQTLPYVLRVVVVALARDRDPVGHKERRVESHAEHPDHVDVVLLALAERLHEVGSSRPGDGAEVLDHFVHRHADAGVAHGERLVVGIVLDLHLQFGSLAEQFRLGHAEEAYLIEGVGRVRDQFAKEYVLVGV